MPNGTRSISRRLRYEILKRDGHRCRYCGAAAPDVQLTIDHVIPVALGGEDAPSNLVTACQDCNAGKSSANPNDDSVEDVRADAEKFRKALAYVSEIDRYKRDLKFTYYDNMVYDFMNEWFGACRINELNMQPDTNARASLIRFSEMGLTELDLIYALHETFARATTRTKGWNYFCKVCWNMIGSRTEMALELIAAEGEQ